MLQLYTDDHETSLYTSNTFKGDYMNSLTKLIAAAFLSGLLFASGTAFADPPRHSQGRGHAYGLDHNKRYVHKHKHEQGYLYYHSHKMRKRHQHRYYEHKRKVYRHSRSEVLIGIMIGAAVGAIILDRQRH